MKHRKSNRLKEFHYDSGYAYFVTICTKGKVNYFGRTINEQTVKNNHGIIVEQQWLWLSQQYSYVILDEYVVMPNHFHGIIIIDDSKINSVGTGRDLSLPIKIKSLSELMGAFKTTSSKLIRQNGLMNFSWQRSFYDRIIRDERELNLIREYINDNPLKWELEKYSMKISNSNSYEFINLLNFNLFPLF